MAARRRPRLPDVFGAALTLNGPKKRFNLARGGRLNKFLASEECPTGTHVVAFGSGLQSLDPVVIDGKTIRLEFEREGDSPLVIQPRAGSRNSDQSALITIKGGTLDLVGANVRLPATSSAQIPPWLIAVEQGSLSVRRCTIEGPQTPDKQHSGLICWIDAANDTGGDNGPPGDLQISDSFLVTRGNILAGPVRSRVVVVTNSVLASGSDAIRLRLDEWLPGDGAFLLDHTTLVASGAILRVEAENPGEPPEVPYPVFARECVFAGPVVETEGLSSTVVAVLPGMIDQGWVTWWGYFNGFAPSLERLLSEGSTSITRLEGESNSWLSRWGHGHELGALKGPTGVVFASSFEALSKLTVTDFRLASSSQAMRWDTSGRSLGADLARVGAEAGGAEAARSPTGPSSTPDRRSLGF